MVRRRSAVPIANTQVYLLDERLRPVPDGEPGNCISGELAWPRAISTAQTSLLSASSHIRLAPSLPRDCTRRATWHVPARWADRISGTCCHQVKVRGYRIEWGEVRRY